MTIIYKCKNGRTHKATSCHPAKSPPGFYCGVREDGVNVRFHRDNIVDIQVSNKGEKK